ncbi:stage III sporulation protein AG [Clostridium tetani]|uniref:Stage III sporulation protein AG n=1 Tax=Clostridium tetani TaxID=1513 RepID=A0ABY0EPT9_CLOTA|nr:stage III sporulation protein AG [Clostridium tetani]CDI49716.1 stage III sporulation protein AG [Clostridium tetani 12124569]KHO38973.1 stage III sporulation protein AG [Clostridium tetani]RXI38021.1 stage III sporulation protein AG [Clostridium tetani]RXI52423.1 stage III sporulation protein AG [Clostridium tetani]RXI70062.1 stage III sporulation protein AG [Clostridium tetani]
MNLKKLLEKIKEDFEKKGSKNIKANLLIVFLIGVLILVTSSFFKSSSTIGKEEAEDNKEIEEVQGEVSIKDINRNKEKQLGIELKQILEKTEGIGNVDVMLYFSEGEEQVPAFNINDSTNLTEETDNEGGRRKTTQKNNGNTVVTTNKGEKTEPLILKTKKPEITGVLIVAEGAENKLTEYRIKKAVINLFNIPENKVNVYPMKK